MSSDRPEPKSPRESRPGDSLLDTIGRRTGRPTRISLHDSDTDDDSPIVDPRVQDFQDQLRGEDRGKYQVLGEIASGGMGVVLRGHDRELGRDVAMKVVHGELSERPEVIERFVEEAQIGGQLQHPGIVPVYELGLMADQRPYFTMKLIKGHTLAKMLARRKDVDADRVRYLTIFGAVCQTMAYAHSKGVIHRDLKPANVMVGSFGEVQVVDWGLSKVLKRGGVADELVAQDEARTVIETVRSGPRTGSDSIVGNVLGTPAYMPPEQAMGKVEELDERADVFALGAILCELLTGAPPYVAGEGQNLVQMAALAELDEAHARIDASSASDALKKLCKACLMPSKQARPDSAEELAEAVQTHIAGLESAAHEAQLAAAEQRVRAERSRRRLQLTLSVGALLAFVAGGWWWTDAQRRERLEGLRERFDDARGEVAENQRAGLFEAAVDAAHVAQRLVASGDADSDLQDRADQLVAASEAAWTAERARRAEEEREQRLLDFFTDVEMRQVRTGIGVTAAELDAEYREAFRAFGLNLDGEGLVARVDELRDTAMGIRIALGADGWARLLAQMGEERAGDIELLTGIGLDLDTDPLRTEARQALFERDAERLVALARGADLTDAEPATLILLASSLARLEEPREALAILADGADRHQESFLLNFAAGRSFFEAERYSRALGYLHAALAIRPDLPAVYSQLGDAYRGTGNYAMAIRWTHEAVEMAPDHTWNARVLGLDYMIMGKEEEAYSWFERQIQDGSFDPRASTFHEMAKVFVGRSTPEEFTAWAAASSMPAPYKWIGTAFMLCTDEIGSLDPERALELLDPQRHPYVDVPQYWMAVALASVLTGDGRTAVETALRSEELTHEADMHDLSQLFLLRACGHRLLGNSREADRALRSARHLRDELIAGNEDEWQDSGLLSTFEQLEPLAAGS